MSTAELLVILVVALVVFGPDKLPMLASKIGKLVAASLRLKNKISHEFTQHQLQFQLDENSKKAAIADKEISKEVEASAPKK